MINSYKEVIEFIENFDNEVNELVMRKRKQFELESNTVEYVKLDRIKENMLATFIKEYKPVASNQSNPSVLRESIDSMMMFLDAVASIDWMKSRYMQVHNLSSWNLDDLDDCDDDSSETIEAVKCFFKSVRMFLVAEQKLQPEEWMTTWEKGTFKMFQSR